MATITVQECRNIIRQFARNAGESVYTIDQIDRAIQAVGNDLNRRIRLVEELDVTQLVVGSGTFAIPSTDFRPERIVEIYLQNGAPSVSFVGGGGTGAIAFAKVSQGGVSGINLSQGGYGYTSAPAVVLASNYGSGAAAVASILNGAVVDVQMTASGTGYAPNILTGRAPFHPAIQMGGQFAGSAGVIIPAQRAAMKIIPFDKIIEMQVTPIVSQPVVAAFESWSSAGTGLGTVYPTPDQPYLLKSRWCPMFTSWVAGDSTVATLTTAVNIPSDIMQQALIFGGPAYLQIGDSTQKSAPVNMGLYQQFLTRIAGTGSLGVREVISRGRW